MTSTMAIRSCATRHLAIIGALVLMSAVVSEAQSPQDLSNLTLEDLMTVRVERVFGASKRVQLTTEAPSSVTIVTADDIARHGYRTLGDIVQSVRGFYVTDDRNYQYVGARGFARPGDYNTRILLVVDGHRVNDDIFDQAAVGRELGLDAASFQRVEIIRGPASALYGTSAFFAVINVTTKRGTDISGVTITAEGGNLGTSRVFAAIGRAFANGADLAFSGHTENAAGVHDLYFPIYDTPATNNGHAIGMDAGLERGMTGRVSVQNLTLSGMYSWRRKRVPTGAYETTFNDPAFVTFDRRAFFDASYEREIARTRYALRAFVDTYDYDGEYPYDGLTPDSGRALQTDYGHGVWWGTEGRASRDVAGGQTLTAGFEFRDYARQNQGAAATDDRRPAFSTHVGTDVYAAYVQDEVRIRERVLLDFGGRYDAYSGFNRLTPRASLVFAASPSRSFKYLYGRAFRAPNAYEFDYLTYGVRDHSLGAETIETNEVVWEEYRGGWLRTAVSAFRNDADHLLTLMADDEGVLSLANAKRAVARGIELEAEMKSAATGLQALASYSWQDAKDGDSGVPLSNSPRHVAKARFSAPGGRAGATIAVEVQAMSRRVTLGGNSANAHAIVNANYILPLGRGTRLTASFHNLFDQDYSDPASAEHAQDAIPQNGRTIRVGVQWGWNVKP